jgi:Kef-type K+ transport system membrane component KefB
MKNIIFAVLVILALAGAPFVYASKVDTAPASEEVLIEETSHADALAQVHGEEEGSVSLPAEEAGHGPDVTTFLWIAVILLAAKLGSLVTKFGQPAVLGELTMGVILGNLALIGIVVLEPIKHDSVIQFLAELGVVILLFQIGLESNISKMRKVGKSVFLVAAGGVILPFVLGTYVIGPWLMPGLDQIAYLFLGAALTATSTGITARVFQDLGKLQSSAAQIVLGAAVVDDVIGLIILGVVSVMAVTGAVTLGIISMIVAKAILFLVGAIVIGHFTAPIFGKLLSKINMGVGMKFAMAVSFGLVFAYIGQEYFGLAAIVGAFAAGLVLDSVHFKYFQHPEIFRDVKEAVKDANGNIRQRVDRLVEHYSHREVEDLIEPMVYFLVPIFFIVTGMSVDLTTLFDLKIVLVALAITVVAFIGKLVAGFAAEKGDRLLVGFGMVPRGEVGLIFATIGASLGVVSDEVFSVIVIMVILTTLLTPPVLTYLLKRQPATTSAPA